MSRFLLVLALVLTGQSVAAERLSTGSVKYLGHFLPPPNQGGGNQGTWNWGMRGLTLIPDCMGEADPSPSDGYPGCLGAFGHVGGFQFGVFDIVPPGNQAQQVVPFYELGAPIAEQQAGRNSINYWDVLYDTGDRHCRLWWTYATWYSSIQDDPPFLGVSTCDPSNPNPQGMWDFGEEGLPDMQADPFHSAKMHQGLSLIPEETADRLFDGKRMMAGISRRSGTRGGSQGPALYVRPLDLPGVPAPGPIMDATPLVWYSLTGFMQWYDQPQMDGPVVHWWSQAKAEGAEFIFLAGAEAVVLPWKEPIINPQDYPCSDPLAYRDSDPTTPDACEVPVCWYGVRSCAIGPPEFEQPSFWEDTATGQPMPMDCNIEDPCGGGKGPHCLSIRPYLLFYDVEELAAVYQGEEPHNYPQPYAKISLEEHILGGTECGAHGMNALTGSTYDQNRQLLYIAQGKDTPAIHLFSIVEIEVFSDDFESGDLSRWAFVIP